LTWEKLRTKDEEYSSLEIIFAFNLLPNIATIFPQQQINEIYVAFETFFPQFSPSNK